MGIIEAAIRTGHLGRSMSLALHRGAERGLTVDRLSGSIECVERRACVVQQYITI